MINTLAILGTREGGNTIFTQRSSNLPKRIPKCPLASRLIQPSSQMLDILLLIFNCVENVTFWKTNMYNFEVSQLARYYQESEDNNNIERKNLNLQLGSLFGESHPRWTQFHPWSILLQASLTTDQKLLPLVQVSLGSQQRRSIFGENREGTQQLKNDKLAKKKIIKQ